MADTVIECICVHLKSFNLCIVVLLFHLSITFKFKMLRIGGGNVSNITLFAGIVDESNNITKRQEVAPVLEY